MFSGRIDPFLILSKRFTASVRLRIAKSRSRKSLGDVFARVGRMNLKTVDQETLNFRFYRFYL